MTHLEEYLKYYCGLRNPRFAVLVTGAWGVGKTHQVKSVLTEIAKNSGAKYIYVSLNGLLTSDEVHSYVLAETDPESTRFKNATDKLGKVVSKFGKFGTAVELVSGMVGSLARASVDPEKTIVFDDLERSGLNVQSTLGVINAYVEHLECRVIVLAHDIKLHDKFDAAKEKLFGHTIRAEAQTASAFDFFVEDADPNGKVFLNEHRDDVLNVFQMSGCESLRVLRHVMSDIERLSRPLKSVHRQNSAAMSELIMLFCALDLEVRNNKNLGEAELSERSFVIPAIIGENAEAKILEPVAAQLGSSCNTGSMIAAVSRYVGIDLGNPVLSDAVLVDMLINGRYHAPSILICLDESRFFRDPDESPAWMTLWEWPSHENDDLEAARDKLRADLEDRKITDIGHLRHSFAVLLSLSHMGVETRNREKIVADAISYIDDITESGLLGSNLRTNAPLDEYRRKSFHGRTLLLSGDAGQFYDQIDASFDKAVQISRAKMLPEVGKKILEALVADVAHFEVLLGIGINEDDQFSGLPVLTEITPRSFVAELMNAPRKNWFALGRALLARAEAYDQSPGLEPERGWGRQLIAEVENVKTSAVPWDRYKLGIFTSDKMQAAFALQTTEPS